MRGSIPMFYAPQDSRFDLEFFSKIESGKVFVCAGVSEKWEILGKGKGFMRGVLFWTFARARVRLPAAMGRPKVGRN